ncbi:MAG TPA: PQQ-binding-like beta-propeller repeat protein [Streptosporangiaceae bacterium]|nr:PQQ-binding-like beta-propeller repeat protein [Streptosporangiaceae bacterium]
MKRLRLRLVARSFWFFRLTELLAMIALLGAAGGIGSGSADAASSPPPSAAGSWTVYHDDPAGNGVAPPVSAVDTTAAVWNSPGLDGEIYGEPLVYAGRVYVATENDTVYALSAATGAVAWSAHLGPPVPSGSLPCGDITPTVGITGTPVIDQARGEIFVVADELAGGKSAHRLVGLATASGRIEMTQDVDPPGADTAALLQRTGLTLDAGQVVFGFGGNYGDCATYQGRVAAAPETGGTPTYFTVDAAPGESQGAVWMGGAAPVVDSHGDIWVSTGNGSVYSDQHAYDDSDSVLELSPSLQLMQFFAPSTWATNNSQDLDMSIAPALLPDGQVVLAGKSRIVYLLNGAHLGGIGNQQATLGANGHTVGTACSDDIDGGVAVTGMTVYLPCLAGIIAVQATSSPAALHLLWSSGTGGGPPIVAAGLVWTMGQNGTLYGLDPATGRVRQQVTVGAPANHFSTPSVGDGLLLAPSAEHVVAFAAPAPGARPAPATASPGQGASAQASPAPASNSGPYLAAIVFVAAAVLIAIGWVVSRRLRRAR